MELLLENIIESCALLTGVPSLGPPQSRYTFVWDVEIVLVYLKINMCDYSLLSDKDLTHKLTVLMNLINTAPRYQAYGKE